MANAPGGEPPESDDSDSMGILEVQRGATADGGPGDGLLFRTNRGDFAGILHQAPDANQAVVWVCGARGGFGGPALLKPANERSRMAVSGLGSRT